MYLIAAPATLTGEVQVRQSFTYIPKCHKLCHLECIFLACRPLTQCTMIGLALPQMHDVSVVLFRRLNSTYPAITFVSIGIELVIFPLFISWRYRDALRVFIQRDDRSSNASWLWKFHCKCLETYLLLSDRVTSYRSWMSQIWKKFWSRRTLRHANRNGTISGERGLQGEASEMANLTDGIFEEPREIATGMTLQLRLPQFVLTPRYQQTKQP